MKIVYLDNAATTKLDVRVFKVMMPYLKDNYANASSIHALGQHNNLLLEKARREVASTLGGEASGIIFTGSASEANNFIIRGIMKSNHKKGKHLIISTIEHPSVYQTAQNLVSEGYELDFVPVDKNGVVDLQSLAKLIRPDTVLVSIMAISKIVHVHGAIFHSDIVQAIPFLKINLDKTGIDCASLSAHKFYGPKGVGLAYIKPGIKISALISGGEQEKGWRAGTYNLPGIIGLAEALKISYRERDTYLSKLKDLRDYFWNSLKKEIPNIKLNGGLKKRAENNLNIRFGRIEGEAILMDLSTQGVCVSTGSACSAHNLKSSYVLSAIGLADYDLNSNIRLSLGRFNTKREIDFTVSALKKAVVRLRAFTPVK